MACHWWFLKPDAILQSAVLLFSFTCSECGSFASVHSLHKQAQGSLIFHQCQKTQFSHYLLFWSYTECCLTALMANAGPCARCEMICMDQTTAVRAGPEPLLTLATYRRQKGRILLGILLGQRLPVLSQWPNSMTFARQHVAVGFVHLARCLNIVVS